MNYTKYHLICTPELTDILIAYLSELDCFDTFSEEPDGLNAFAPVSHDRTVVESALADLSEQFRFEWTTEELIDQNWNEVWESNFPVVNVDDFCAVRAEFHAPVPEVVYEIVIQPKMAFGTGHHNTTRMMLSAMREVDFKGKSVFDYGCGTAVLAILAGMMGATDIVGVDNEEPAYLNSLENAARNGFPDMQIIHGTLDDVPVRPFDIILANINRNIILQSLARLAEMSHSGTLLFTSGYLIQDKEVLAEAAKTHGFGLKEAYQTEDWVCLVFEKNAPKTN